ncbi:MAG: hypothetical protein CVV44_21925 [Spirochaetae bacterium HGW-Spirochaetae-1]|jgi:diguanylate cyclase (GGDEF)-like protein/PAS domain S-box-containing protein|nr:MAG: hypothetical protein CVV44_21925 [Spirochaetae bacterium HGW-Spirochaetae-1]
MIPGIINYFLERYRDSDYIIQQKSRVLLSVLLAIMVLSPVVLGMYIYRGHLSATFFGPVITICIFTVVSLVILRMGFYQIASHLSILTLMSGVWYVLFMDTNQPLLARMDTIVYIPGILIMVPLLTVKRRILIILYYAVNIAILIFYGLTISSQYALSQYITFDYLMDNIIVMLFMGIASYQIFNIDTSALIKAKKAEQAVAEQNQQLEVINNALESANDELINFQRDLKKSEEKYRTLVEMADEIIWSGDIKGNYTFMNRAAERVMGYRQMEIIGHNFAEFTTPELAKHEAAIVRELVRRKGNSARYETTYFAKDGTPIHFIIALILIRDDSGWVIGATGTATDITKRKVAERKIQQQNEELAASNEELEAMNEELIASQNELMHNEESIREKESAIRALLNATTDTVFMLNNEGVILIANSSTSKQYKNYLKNFIGHNYFEHLEETGQKDRLNRFKSILVTKEQCRFEDERKGYIFDINAYPILDHEGEVSRIAIFSRDITEQKNAERKIREQNEELVTAARKFESMNEELVLRQIDILNSEMKYRHLYENALVGMATTRASDGMILKVNEHALKLFGFASEEEVVNKRTIDEFYADPQNRNQLLHELKTRETIHNYELQFIKNDSMTFWAEVTAKLYLNDDKIETVFMDISKRKIAEENVHKLTFYDSLTDLPNKKMFLAKLQSEIMKSQRKSKENLLSVMCIGLDRFKHINDIHGSAIGDLLLKSIAGRLKVTYREDDIVSRFDGDKFMTLFSDLASADDIIDVVRKTFESFTEPFVLGDLEFYLTASLGVCVYPNDGDNAEMLINNSENAMYNAKEKGRNTYQLFDAELNDGLLNRIKMEQELKDAINNHEFETFFQPKVDFRGNIIGMESLIRWNSALRGSVPPLDFIGLAEKNGMIIEIGNIVLRESCRWNKKWQNMGFPPMKVSVNISPFQFRQDNLIETINNILHETGMAPQWLELEITESGIMENEEENIKKLHSLHELGISISIDDFGTGYSSLSKLKDYPIDTLKIDKTFIDEVPQNIKSMTLATTIIDLAHNLGFKVVAEGIERKDQLDFLHEQKCDHYQGYLFNPPLTAEDFEKKLRASFDPSAIQDSLN